MKKVQFSQDSLIFITTVGFYIYCFLNSQTSLIRQDLKILLISLSSPLMVLFIIGDLFGKAILKWLVLASAVVILVIAPTIVLINQRHQTQPYLFVHDNPIQIEEAIKFLLNGIDPYGQDYSKTILGKWPYYHPTQQIAGVPEVNPAEFHLVSLPFGFISVAPFYLIGVDLFHWFDARIFYLLCYLGLLLVASFLVDKQSRISFLTLFSLNPLFSLFIIEGHNDVLNLLLIITTLLLAFHKRYLWSAIALGLAISTKQTGWVFLIIYLPYLFFKTKNPQLILKFIVLTLICASILIAPFYLWNPIAFVDDTFRYVSGGLATSYPINGLGFSMLLSSLDLIKDQLNGYNSSLFQLIAGVPILLMSLNISKDKPSLRAMMVCFGILFLTLAYFSRFFEDSYLGVALEIFIMAYFLKADYSSR